MPLINAGLHTNGPIRYTIVFPSNTACHETFLSVTSKSCKQVRNWLTFFCLDIWSSCKHACRPYCGPVTKRFFPCPRSTCESGLLSVSGLKRWVRQESLSSAIIAFEMTFECIHWSPAHSLITGVTVPSKHPAQRFHARGHCKQRAHCWSLFSHWKKKTPNRACMKTTVTCAGWCINRLPLMHIPQKQVISQICWSRSGPNLFAASSRRNVSLSGTEGHHGAHRQVTNPRSHDMPWPLSYPVDSRIGLGSARWACLQLWRSRLDGHFWRRVHRPGPLADRTPLLMAEDSGLRILRHSLR